MSARWVQVEVTKTAKEAGISIPVFLKRTVFDTYVAVPPDVTGQDEAGRLWDIVWMLRFAISRSRGHSDRVPVALYVRNGNTRTKLIKLIAQCGPLDMDEPQPAITVIPCACAPSLPKGQRHNISGQATCSGIMSNHGNRINRTAHENIFQVPFLLVDLYEHLVCFRMCYDPGG